MTITEISITDGMFGALCAMSFVILYASTCIIALSQTYVILKSYSNYIAMIQFFFASIVLWISFVTNQPDVFSNMLIQTTKGCVMWAFMIPYIFGFMPWILLQEYRMLRHGFAHNYEMMALSNRRIKFIYTLVFSITFGTISVICYSATIDVFMNNNLLNNDRCNNMYIEKSFLMGWLIIHHIGILLGCFMINKGVRGQYTEQNSCMRDISVYGIIATVVCFYIQTNNFNAELGWRLAYTVVELSFFSFAFFRTVFFRLYKCLRRDKKYLRLVCNSIAMCDLVLESGWDLIHSDSEVKNFIDWVRTQPNKIDNRPPKSLVHSDTVGNCYMMMREWTIQSNNPYSDRAKNRKDAEDICDKYITNQTGMVNIIPKTIETRMYMQGAINFDNPDLFVEAEMYLYSLISYLWGNVYLFNYTRIKSTSGSDFIEISGDGIGTEMSDMKSEEDGVVVSNDIEEILVKKSRKDKRKQETTYNAEYGSNVPAIIELQNMVNYDQNADIDFTEYLGAAPKKDDSKKKLLNNKKK